MNPDVFSIWTITDHPIDFPGHFVARRWEIRSGLAVATQDFQFAETLEGIRALLPPGLCRLPREFGDERPIIESWF